MVQLSLPKNSAMTEGRLLQPPQVLHVSRHFRVYRWSPDDSSPPSTLYEVDLDTWVLDMLRTRSYVTTGSATSNDKTKSGRRPLFAPLASWKVRRCWRAAERIRPMGPGQSPKRSGRSRHGMPARYRYKTASTNNRLSAAVPPTWPSRPGRKSLSFQKGEAGGTGPLTEGRIATFVFGRHGYQQWAQTGPRSVGAAPVFGSLQQKQCTSAATARRRGGIRGRAVSSAATHSRSSPIRSRSPPRGKPAVQQDLTYRRQTARMRVVAAINRSLFGGSSFGPTDLASDQPIGGTIAVFQVSSFSPQTPPGDLEGLRHGFGTAVNRSALTRSRWPLFDAPVCSEIRTFSSDLRAESRHRAGPAVNAATGHLDSPGRE